MLTLEHVGICARNTAFLKDWYVKVFGLKVVYNNQKPQPTFFLLMEDGNMLEIYPMEEETVLKSNKHQGIRHLAFGTDDIESQHENLLRNGVEIIDALKDNGKGVKTVFFKDVEGNIIHFIQREKSLV